MRSVALLIMLAACGGSGGGTDSNPGPDGSVDPAMRYEPWATGAVWSYKLTDPTGALAPQMNKLTTIMGPRDVGGIHAGTTALLVHIEQMDGSKDVYEDLVGELDIRYKTVFFDNAGNQTSTDVDDPYRLKLDESAAHTVTGAAWAETFTETSTGSPPASKTEQWRVISANEQLTVIAGTYTTLHVRRTSSSGKIQDYWYARGVGKVKETGGGQEEELMSYTPGQ